MVVLLGNRPAFDFFVFRQVQIVLNDPGDFILFVGYRRIFPQLLKGNAGEHHLGGDPFLGAFRGETRQLIAGLLFVCLGKDFL